MEAMYRSPGTAFGSKNSAFAIGTETAAVERSSLLSGAGSGARNGSEEIFSFKARTVA